MAEFKCPKYSEAKQNAEERHIAILSGGSETDVWNAVRSCRTNFIGFSACDRSNAESAYDQLQSCDTSWPQLFSAQQLNTVIYSYTFILCVSIYVYAFFKSHLLHCSLTMVGTVLGPLGLTRTMMFLKWSKIKPAVTLHQVWTYYLKIWP